MAEWIIDEFNFLLHFLQFFVLSFLATQSLLNIKLDIATLTDIPVSKQVWTGWPKDSSDELSLAQLGIPQEHHLTVNRLASESVPPRSVSSTYNRHNLYRSYME